MLPKVFSGVFIVLVCTAICSSANEDQQSNSSYATSPGLRSMMRIYDECQRSDGGVTMCLKKKAVTFIDRISKIDVINIGDGVRVVGEDGAAVKTIKSFNENDLDQMRSLEDRDSFLNEMLAEKLANYISGRKIQINLPQVTPNELGRGLEEGERFCLVFQELIRLLIWFCTWIGGIIWIFISVRIIRTVRRDRKNELMIISCRASTTNNLLNERVCS